MKNDLSPEISSAEDAEFDAFYPQAVRAVSGWRWTPLEVARWACEYLVSGPGIRVLDVGCGPGKFCLAGAMNSAGHFTGVEQSEDLVRLARVAQRGLGLRNAEFLHGNILEVDFGEYDAFYIYNPFEENLVEGGDRAEGLSAELYEKYVGHVTGELSRMPQGTRVVTYHGSCEEVPEGFECERTAFGGSLKFWRRQG